jgi:hypothetical protein
VSVSYPHARRHDRPHARGGKEDEAAKPRDGNDRAVDVVVMAHWLASAHGRRCRGRWVGATCRSGRGQCSSLSHALATMEGRRAQHVCSRPAERARMRGVGMLARMGASADGEAMGDRGAGGRVVAGDTSRAARTKWARENGGHHGGGERASDERCNK